MFTQDCFRSLITCVALTSGLFTSVTTAYAASRHDRKNNIAPVISGTPAASVEAGEPYSFQPTASDPDGDALRFRIRGKPAWASFDRFSGALTGTPGVGDTGTYRRIRISVTDGIVEKGLRSFDITVDAAATASNNAPKISGQPETTIAEGNYYSFAPTAYDADGDALTFSISNKPSWASFNTGTGRMSGTPQPGDVGTYADIVIGASDGRASDALPPFSVDVGPADQATSSVTVSWARPTKNADGSSLVNLAGYRLYYGTVSGQYDQHVAIPSPDVTSVAVENLASARWYFAVRAYNEDGIESDFSTEVSKAIQ